MLADEDSDVVVVDDDVVRVVVLVEVVWVVVVDVVSTQRTMVQLPSRGPSACPPALKPPGPA